jgi:hypothetical protein
VVAPHREVLYVLHAHAELAGQLRDRPVLVQPGHRREALRRDVGCVAERDQRVGVGRVADHQHAQVVGGTGVERLALRLEDLAVGLEQVGSLHPLRPRTRAHQQRHVHAVEGLHRVVVDLGRREQREGAVLQLERRPLGGLHGVGDLEQPQVDLLVRAEHLPGGDAKQQRVADLPGGAGYGDGGSH